MKKGRLSKEEKTLITEKLEKKQSVEKIAKTLDRSIEIVQNYINTLSPKEKELTFKQELFARSMGKSGRASVMTESASQLTEVKTNKGNSRYSESCIHKIR